MVEQSKDWLVKQALPLWFKKGIDQEKGGFWESLSLAGEPLDQARRAIVQTRQIFTFRTAIELHFCDQEHGESAIASGLQFLFKNYSQASGAFIHAVDRNGKIADATVDLYTQAFALFGMANAYAVIRQNEIKARAQALVAYLYRERQHASGGFTELKDNKILYQSNPHMHLFEAALYWMEVDKDPVWRRLADEILELCKTKFIDQESGILGEHFSEHWEPLLEAGKYVFEPGHQYEWSWLMGRYQNLTGIDLLKTRLQLFELSEKVGICPQRKSVYNQVWSDLSPKQTSSRFWPQCERIKAAAQLQRQLGQDNMSSPYARAAEEAMQVLFRYFELPVRGLWYDSWESNGSFKEQASRASSFYHIIGAISEYLAATPTLR